MTLETIPINWADPKAKISDYFKVKEATYLIRWNVYHTPTEQEIANILRMAEVMDKIRAFLGCKVEVHCWIRPAVTNCQNTLYRGKDYNKLVGGAKASAHLDGLAVDFHAEHMLCDEVRAKLLPKLEEWDIRMENLPRSGWVHVDLKPPFRGNRYFKP